MTNRQFPCQVRCPNFQTRGHLAEVFKSWIFNTQQPTFLITKLVNYPYDLIDWQFIRKHLRWKTPRDFYGNMCENLLKIVSINVPHFWRISSFSNQKDKVLISSSGQRFDENTLTNRSGHSTRALWILRSKTASRAISRWLTVAWSTSSSGISSFRWRGWLQMIARDVLVKWRKAQNRSDAISKAVRWSIDPPDAVIDSIMLLFKLSCAGSEWVRDWFHAAPKCWGQLVNRCWRRLFRYGFPFFFRFYPVLLIRSKKFFSTTTLTRKLCWVCDKGSVVSVLCRSVKS